MEHIGPWKRKSSLLIYSNAWINVRHDEVILPNQSEGIYGVVEFKNRAVGVVPLLSSGHIVLVGQYRYPLNEYSWEIPEGGCPIGENLLDAAKRELSEETGYVAAEWIDLGGAVTSNSVCDEVGQIYLARQLTPGNSNPDATEEIEVKFVPFDEAYQMAMRGDITDSISVMGIARAYWYLNGETRN